MASFARALDEIQRDVERQLCEEDAAYIRRVGRISTSLEVTGRGLIHFSLEPLTFSLGVTALWGHKCLELMEIGHMALHGSYDKLPDTERYHAKRFHWKAPIEETSWRRGHNVRHHQYTNIEGRDPDLDFGGLRLSARIPYRRLHRAQPATNLLTWFAFATAINFHVTGLIEQYLPTTTRPKDEGDSAAKRREGLRAFRRKALRYYGRELVFFPMLAGPFFWKTLLGNLLSEVGRDLYAGATIYCGHVGAVDFPAGTRAGSRARWYEMQAEAARDVRVPKLVSILSGALDRQIEHHLFPRLPPNRLRQIAPRVKAACEAHGVRYLEKGPLETLRDVAAELWRLSSPEAEPLGSKATTAPAAA